MSSSAADILECIKLRETTGLSPFAKMIVEKVLDLGPDGLQWLADDVDDNTSSDLPYSNYSEYWKNYSMPLLRSTTNGVNKVVEIFATLIGYIQKYPHSAFEINEVFFMQQHYLLSAYIKSIQVIPQDMSGRATRNVPIHYRPSQLPMSIIKDYFL